VYRASIPDKYAALACGPPREIFEKARHGGLKLCVARSKAHNSESMSVPYQSFVNLRWRRIDAGADVWAICVEARDIRIHQRHESYFCVRNVARQVLEQFFKLIFMSSDSIHDAVLCAERRGRTPARSIDAALLA
jgi:hypothetical protein